MTEIIPDDVMVVAKAVHEQIWRQIWDDSVPGDDPDLVIARAILAERERCAKIADDMYGSSHDRTKGIRPTGAGALGELCLAIGGEATANAIRIAIRTPA